MIHLCDRVVAIAQLIVAQTQLQTRKGMFLIPEQILSLWGLRQRTVGLVQSWFFAPGAVGQLFDVDRTASAPARSSQQLKFLMDLTVQFSVGKEHTFLLTFQPIPTPHFFFCM